MISSLFDWITDRIIQSLEPKIEQLIDRQLIHTREEIELIISNSLDHAIKEATNVNPFKRFIK